MNKETIRKLVEQYYELDITSQTRKRKYVEARAMYYKLVRDNTRLSLEAIGKTVSRDHASVLHGVNTLSDWVETDPTIKGRYRLLKKQLQEMSSIASKHDLINEVDQAVVLELTNLRKSYRELLEENKTLIADYENLRVKHDKREKFYTKLGFVG